MVARYIAEGLISIGQKLWFAEYFIHERKHDSAIHEELAHGIDSSTKAICLTNQSYAESIWCYTSELIPLIKKLGIQNIVEIKIPNENITKSGFPSFFPVSMEWGNSYNEVFNFLGNAGIIDQKPPRNWDRNYYNKSNYLRNEDIGILFDLSGWEKIPLSELALEYGHAQNQRAYLRSFGEYVFGLHALFQSVDFNKDRKSKIRRIDDSLDNDEIFYRNLEETKEYIELHLRQNNLIVKLLGVHPFYILGYAHYAFTYTIIDDTVSKIMRKYIINLPHKKSYIENEIIVTANISHHSRNINLREFLQVIPVIDQFIYSAEYE